MFDPSSGESGELSPFRDERHSGREVDGGRHVPRAYNLPGIRRSVQRDGAQVSSQDCQLKDGN